MNKEVNVVNGQINSVAITVKELFLKYDNLSIRKFSEELGLCYQYILKLSKQPIKGQSYDPAKINFEAIQKVVDNKRIIINACTWDDIMSKVKVYEPLNKIEDFKVNTVFKLRNDNQRYEIVYMTDSHIVFIGENTTQPRVMNNDTFLHQSPRIVNAD